jgi:phospholipid transport system substrate-binding protein
MMVNNSLLYFRHLLTAMLVFVATALSGHLLASEIDDSDPYRLVETVAMKTFDRIKANQDKLKTDPDFLRTIMEEELLPHIDYQFAAFMVLGKYFKSVPKEKLNEDVTVFREYLITTYSVAMGYYDNQTVVFEPSSEFADKKLVTVRAVIQDSVRPEIKIAFKVRKDSKTNQWKAYDMVAEGISMLNSKRSEFEEMLRQDGVDAVIAVMREKISQPVNFESSTTAATEQ